MADVSREQADAEYAYREGLYTLAKESECSVCGRRMDVRTIANTVMMACPTDPTHPGYRKRRSLTQLAEDGYYIPYVSELVQRRRQRKNG